MQRSKRSGIFVTSDTHFNHSTMIKEQWRKFKTVEEMNEFIIKQWNSVVNPNDTVYHLGDVALNKKTDYDNNIQPRLNGNIIYIKGNHDPLNISNIQSMIILFQGKSVELVHNPIDSTFSTDYVIHGHIHKYKEFNTDEPNRFYNVNVEFHKFKPKLLNNIIGELKLKK